MNAKRRRSMRKAANRIREKIQNLIDEVHKKAAHYLTNNYGLIFLPRFESSLMVAKSRRKIRSKTVRSMLTWGACAVLGFPQVEQLKYSGFKHPQHLTLDCLEDRRQHLG
ncbi:MULTISPECIES: hypothetical protein [Planktothricoides]|uniref:Transposase n=1 Tax=Planktothricoides raciborskii GIHE-MW2 TaxID=2792601 RepID=A0AAU8JF30_9CYAN|nr:MULTISPECIES: hypothetical protein [Planktothricoides]